jgi:transcriptional regulator with XRE-family HTH domain
LKGEKALSGLRVLRESQGFGLREASRLVGISSAHLSRVERGLGGLSTRTLLSLLRLYRVGPTAKALAALVAIKEPEGTKR